MRADFSSDWFDAHLTAAKLVKLGGPKLAEAREAAAALIKAFADRHAAHVLAIIVR
jgi:hypothetical protein